MKAARCLVLAIIGISVHLVLTQAQADDGSSGPSIETHGEAKKIIRRNKVEVLELRGARRNPNFLEESFHKSEVRDVARWNQQHDNITPVKGLKRARTRMPASEPLVKHHEVSSMAKSTKAQSVASQQPDFPVSK